MRLFDIISNATTLLTIFVIFVGGIMSKGPLYRYASLRHDGAFEVRYYRLL